MELILVCLVLVLVFGFIMARPFLARADDAEVKKDEKNAGVNNKLFAAALVVFLLIGSFGFYIYFGSLDSVSSSKITQKNPDVEMGNAISLVKEQLEKAPSIEGYKLLGSAYFSMGNYTKSAESYEKAINMGADDAESWADFGEAMVLANSDMITMHAMNAFYRSLGHDHKNPRARFYIGLANLYIGNNEKAIAIWKGVLEDSNPDLPWVGMVKEHINKYAEISGINIADVKPYEFQQASLHHNYGNHENAGHSLTNYKPEGDSVSDVDSLTDVSVAPALDSSNLPEWADDPEQRSEMIYSMVERLAGRLADNPKDETGWIRLVKAYRVLGEDKKAADALEKALKANPESSGLKGLAEKL
jgi:cytochrome c-type biogenesis protein CcmH